MADEEAKKEAKAEKPAKKGFNIKVILFGLPLFIIQLVLVYFITANFLVKSASESHKNSEGEQVENSDSSESEDTEESESSEESEGEEGKGKSPVQIFSIDDLIINPAGTSGQRLLLLSVGFGVSNEEKVTMLKENEIVIKDLILNSMSQKSLAELSRVELKDSLKIEIMGQVNKLLPKAKIKNVYFSKYVIN
ncbi:MAG: flagellar basal body-associated FliL family protein [Ignavibacteriales bacterium]|jgi:flagellar protein FliL|nr:flagellar basal body-associated FliL family protein [Ignavibacteriales bacterium]